MGISVDPATGGLVGVDRDRTYSLREVLAISAHCPVCAGKVTVKPIRRDGFTPVPESEAYMLGRHGCENGCNLAVGSAE